MDSERLKRLDELNEEYRRIIWDDKMTDEQKDKKISELMTIMEGEFQIPGLRDPNWERWHQNIIDLYKRLSNGRRTL